MTDLPALAPAAAPAARVGWPDNSHRVIVLGRTGSGKSVLSLWLLSTRNFHEMPWIIFDYKRDRLIRQIQAAGAVELLPDKDGVYEAPILPGLYIVRPDSKEPAAIDDLLHKVWLNERTGLYFDEGFFVPQHKPYKSFDNILVTGRSMDIPVIINYQRPKWMSQFATSQADFWAVFHVLKEEDRDTIEGYVGQGVTPSGEPLTVNTKLPRHYCLWYDVSEDRVSVFSPVPAPEAIVERFRARLMPPETETEEAPEITPQKRLFI